MVRIMLMGLVVLGISLVACAVPTPTTLPATAVPSTTPARKAGTIRISVLGTLDVKDIPRLMAADSLRQQGYTVQFQTFASSNLIPVAMQQGDIDIGTVTSNIEWTAISKGIDIRSIVGETNMTFYLVTKESIQSCRDLNGRTLAFSTRQAVGYVMFEDYIQQNCPGTVPQIVLINDSTNRVASLQSDSVDGAYVEIEGWLTLNHQAPGKYRLAIDFGKEFPDVQYSTFSVRRAWAEQNPEIVRDFIRALLIANRKVAGHPDVLRDEIVKYLSVDAAQAQEWADVFTAANIWDVNGALTDQNIKSTIEYLSTKSTLPSTLHPGDVADLSYLNAVLDEIGRQ